MPTVQEAMTIALSHHQTGRLQQAEQIYRQVLQVLPDHADALHLMGLLAYQGGRHAVAIEYIGRALLVNPHAAAYHNNLGTCYRELERIDDAVASYRRALELQPDYADANYNLRVALQAQGKWDEAAACYRQALPLQQDYAELCKSLGNAIGCQGKLHEAAEAVAIRGIDHVVIICSSGREPDKYAKWREWIAASGFGPQYAEIYFYRWADELTDEDIDHYSHDDGTLHRLFPFRAKLERAELSLAVNFIKVFAIAAAQGYHNVLVLESDTILHPDFKATVEREMEILARRHPEWDILSLGCGMGLRPKAPNPNEHLCRVKRLRCTDSLVFSWRAIQILHHAIKQVRLPIDHEIEVLVANDALCCYWLEPPIAAQASQIGDCATTVQPGGYTYLRHLPWDS